MMDDKPTVSFIIPCYNQAVYLYEAVRSINHSYSGPKDILIIDDHSSSLDTSRLLNEIKNDFPAIRVIYNEFNKGLSATRNIGISASIGEFIQFLDADDLLLPGKIDYQIEQFRLGNDLDISISDFYIGDENLSDFKNLEPSIGAFTLSLDDFLYYWERGLLIPIHCALFKKDVLLKTQFEDSLSAKEDWFFWCKLAYLGRKIAFLNYFGAVYRQHEGAMTKRKLGAMGKMWLKASLMIDDFIEKKDNTFLNSSLDWYETHYKHLSDIEAVEPVTVENPGEVQLANIDNTIFLSSRIHEKPKHEDKTTYSIVVPVYNHFKYLGKCFESIFSQSFCDYEVICIDDNSTDPKVKEFLLSLESKIPNITVRFNPVNQGISSTLNQAVSLAHGQYIAFLDCDDYLPSTALQEVHKFLMNSPEADYFFTDKIDIDGNGEFLRESQYGGYRDIKPSGDIEDDLLDGMVASHLKIIKKDAITKAGGFNSLFDGVQDYDLALRILKNGAFKYINRPLYYHRQHVESVTTSQTVKQFRNMNLARRNYCEKAYPKTIDPTEGIDLIKEYINSGSNCSQEQLIKNGVATFTLKDISIPEVKEKVKQGMSVVLDARINYQIDQKYFIREYNSYFDLILTNDARTTISVIGSLWDDAILWMPLFAKTSYGKSHYE